MTQKRTQRPSGRKLLVETLEDRRMLSGVPNGTADLGVHYEDLATWEANFGATEGTVAAESHASANGDDFLQWQRNYNDGPAAIVSVGDATAARNALLAGVTQIATVGSPGEIAVFDPPGAGAGQGAFGVIHDGSYRQMVAAAVWGSGKVVAFGHNGYTDFSAAGDSLDTGQFYLNSVAWTTGIAGTSPTIVTNSTGTQTWLQSQGFTNVSVHSNWESFLTGADLLVVELGRNISTAKQTAVSNFVQNGGGLITGGTGWGYKSLGSDLVTMDGNVVLREAGLAWPDGFRSGTTTATNQSTELANASRALEFAEQLWAGGSGTLAQQEEAGEALQTVLEILPAAHPLAVAIGDAFSVRAGAISATPATPVSNPLEQAILTWEAAQLEATPFAEVTAHHSAAAVYGAIPAGAPRLANQVVSINANKTGLLDTGLYAAPGDLISITVPSSMVGKGYSVRLGGHVDNISPRSSWNRVPFGISRSVSLDSTSVQVASAFGGAIYVDVGGGAEGTAPNLGVVGITVDGAIAAPYFVLGETTDADWINTIRDNPAPYAEFVSEHLSFSVPSDWIRTLGDIPGNGPTALMTYWNDTVAFQDFVGGFEDLRSGPDRINLDVQISVGLLHAGNPIQGPTSYGSSIVDLDTLTHEGDWGWFHELGHEMQGHSTLGWGYDNPFTFPGDVEVTVNIFSNAALELNAPNTPTAGWGYSVYPDLVMNRAISSVNNAGAANFDAKDPYPFYFQLADGEWGWQGYRDVIGSYVEDQQTNPGAIPQNAQQEKDQWLIRWSQETGYDMTEYMVDNWKLEVSTAARNTVGLMGLPGWMPLATTIDDFQIDPGNTQLVSTASGGLGMDGVATFVGIEVMPQHGTLTNNGNGSYTYEPTIQGGLDSFVVTYQSSAGNTQDFTIDVTIGNGSQPGDVDQDGDLDMNDVTQFIAGWRSDTSALDESGKIMAGDLNLDGTTNFSDWYIINQAWIAQGGAPLNFATLVATAESQPASEGPRDSALAALADSDLDLRWTDEFAGV